MALARTERQKTDGDNLVIANAGCEDDGHVRSRLQRCCRTLLPEVPVGAYMYQ